MHCLPSGLVRVMALLCAAGCASQEPRPTVKPLPEPDPYPVLLAKGPLSSRIASYRIEVTLDASAHKLFAKQRLSWTNPAGRPIDVLPFHLYMNAFKNDESVFLRESHGKHRSARATRNGWGWIEVSSIRVGETELVGNARYPGLPDETVMEVPLPQPVAPGGRIDLDMTFEVALPVVFARTGYKGSFHMIGQWFPKIGVLVGEPGKETWRCDPFHLNSEFFADFGTYDVELTVPDTFVVAATGVLVSARERGDGTRTLTYRAEDVHDFAWMADPHMKVMSAQARTELGSVEVRVYYRKEQEAFAGRHLRAGVGAIQEFSKRLVPYPWPIMTVIDPPVNAAGGAGGMEYPTLVTTAADSVFIRPGIRLPELITIHEIGHNWFQGILASNEVDEAWLDEGVNEYMDARVLEALYGKDRSLLDWHGIHADALEINRAGSEPMAGIAAPVATVSYAFPDPASYAQATYLKASLALATLESIVGRDELDRAFAAYARQLAFHHPTGADFFGMLEKTLGRDMKWFLDPAFHQIGAIEYEVRDIECTRDHEPRGVFGRGQERKTVTEKEAPDQKHWVCEILLVNLGRVPAPADVRIEFADGTSTRQRWTPVSARAWEHLRVEHEAQVTRVTIDPEDQVLLNDQLMSRDVRTQVDRSASRRAGARVQFWTQSAMQVLGL